MNDVSLAGTLCGSERQFPLPLVRELLFHLRRDAGRCVGSRTCANWSAVRCPHLAHTFRAAFVRFRR